MHSIFLNDKILKYPQKGPAILQETLFLLLCQHNGLADFLIRLQIRKPAFANPGFSRQALSLFFYDARNKESSKTKK